MFKNLLIAAILIGFGTAIGALATQQSGQADKVKKNARALLDTATRGLALTESKAYGSPDFYHGSFTWSKRVADAELGVSENSAERVAALERHLKRTIKLEQSFRQLYARKAINEIDVLEAEYHRREAEWQLEMERASGSRR